MPRLYTQPPYAYGTPYGDRYLGFRGAYGRAAVIRTQDYTTLQVVAIDHSATARYTPGVSNKSTSPAGFLLCSINWGMWYKESASIRALNVQLGATQFLRTTSKSIITKNGQKLPILLTILRCYFSWSSKQRAQSVKSTPKAKEITDAQFSQLSCSKSTDSG